MRRTTITLLTAACLALAGCGGTDQADSKPSPKKTVDKATLYLDKVRAADLPFTGERPGDGDLVEFPPKWCDGLDAGHSVDFLFGMQGENLYPVGYDWGLKKQDANRLLVIGVKIYCPANLDAVTAELRADGSY